MTTSNTITSTPQHHHNALAETLGKLLLTRQLTISCAESCTGGGIAYAITSVAGSSAWFHQSWVCYSNLSKQDMLHVSEETLSEFGAVSKQTAKAMLSGASRGAKAHVAISVTGIAGPDGGTNEKPVGLVWFGFKVLEDEYLVSQQFLGDRSQVRHQAIAFALEFLIACLVD